MNAKSADLDHHPAPQRDRVMTIESAFGLLGGPLGWYLQLCAGYSLASAPCFENGARTLTLSATYLWTWHVMIAASIAATVIGLAAVLVSWRILQRTKEETHGDHNHLIEVGSGRTRFLALWGVCLSGGFTVFTLLTFVAFIALPRCVG